MNSAKITFYPSKITGTVPAGITVLDAARRLGVNLERPCGGNGKCGKDMVQHIRAMAAAAKGKS